MPSQSMLKTRISRFSNSCTDNKSLSGSYAASKFSRSSIWNFINSFYSSLIILLNFIITKSRICFFALPYLLFCDLLIFLLLKQHGVSICRTWNEPSRHLAYCHAEYPRQIQILRDDIADRGIQ